MFGVGRFLKKNGKAISKRVAKKAIRKIVKKGKREVNDIENYALRVETFHSNLVDKVTEGKPFTEFIADNEVSLVNDMEKAIKAGSGVGSIKKEMLTSFIKNTIGFKGKYINLIIELVVFLITD